MSLLSRLKERLSIIEVQIKDTDPVKAYDLWSQSYDVQPDNLMLDLDNKLFSGLLNNVRLENKVVVDIGCGTGRNWNKILLKNPQILSGYDVSIGMLNRLKDKFPDATVYVLQDNKLPELKNDHCDIIISTLTIAHIEQIYEAFSEWHRVLKTGGELIITDYHPVAFINGGNRTFSYNGQTIAIKNYIHKTDEVIEILQGFGFELISFIEKRIDNSMRHYYEEKKALHVFEKFKNIPIIYGVHLKKKNAIK